MDEKKMLALFELADIEVKSHYAIKNGYWCNTPQAPPWWLVKTPVGLIQIGWRKRVINIDWTDTPIREEITKDEVTKDNVSVHAWGYAKAVQYLTMLRDRIDALTTSTEPVNVGVGTQSQTTS